MTLPRYRAICDHWERSPPLGVTAWAIAESLGAKKKTPTKRKDDPKKGGDLQGLLELLGGGGSGFSRSERPAWMTTK
jgi:hypothetical protein